MCSTKYNSTLDQTVKSLASAGYSQRQIARYFQIKSKTLWVWLTKHPAFRQSWESGRSIFESSTTAYIQRIINKEEVLSAQEELKALAFLLSVKHPALYAQAYKQVFVDDQDQYQDQQTLELVAKALENGQTV